MLTKHALLKFGAALLLFVAGSSSTGANATDRSIAVGAGIGYAVQNESPFVHGLELRALARVRPPKENLQPRVEFLYQHFAGQVEAMLERVIAWDGRSWEG